MSDSTFVAARWRLSLFSTKPGGQRFRRATDVILLVPALIALAVLVAAYPPGPFERAVAAALNALPSWIDPVWGFVFDLFWLWAIVLVVIVVVARRTSAAVQALVAAALAFAVALVAARLASGGWPDVRDALAVSSNAPAFPAVRVALAASVILTISPYLIRPAQRVNHLVLVLGFSGGLFLDHASPSGDLAALMVAVVAASAVRLIFGTAAGRPGLAEIAAALVELGIEATQLELAERQTAGVVLASATDAEGGRLAIKLHGRDAYDNQLLEKIWRFLWYEDGGPPLRLSRGQVAEYEAFVTLLARSFDVPAYEVLRAGTTTGDNGMLVLRGDARPLGSLRAAELRRRSPRPELGLAAPSTHGADRPSPPRPGHDRSLRPRDRFRRPRLRDDRGNRGSPADRPHPATRRDRDAFWRRAGPRRRGRGARHRRRGRSSCPTSSRPRSKVRFRTQPRKPGSRSTSCARKRRRSSTPRSPGSSGCDASPGAR